MGITYRTWKEEETITTIMDQIQKAERCNCQECLRNLGIAQLLELAWHNTDICDVRIEN